MEKKSLVCSFLIFFLFLQFGNLIAKAEEDKDEPKQLHAQSAVLMDADSGRVLYGKEENQIRPMASTTKIMTCILALEEMEKNQMVTISDYAAEQPKVHLGVQSQERYYLKDLLYSLMLESHNDSAVAIAEGIAGSVESFADRMNRKAKELGCNHTYFVTPNGLDDSDEEGTHSTTARDLAMIMRYCMMQSPMKEEFLEITQTRSYQFTDVDGKRNFTCTNHNAFLDMMEGALTGKTGFTADAGYCYVGGLRQNGKTFIVALLACGWPNHKSYKWEDTRALMEYGLNEYEYRNVWQEVSIPDVFVTNGVRKQSPFESNIQIEAHVDGKEDIPVLLRDDEQVKVQTEVESSVEAPVVKGETLGIVRYILEGEEIASYDVIADESIEKRTFKWCMCWILKCASM
ncbi:MULTISPECIES: D-alanyl-D-alanine carboxypeptidase family protein [Lachnospiraceae]|uniref:D-alanyl-D-alanine carboxypeptidase family protein n=1 Tax=Lachnospiraceae TaxID=186803 RepID=UPI001F413BAF|nr:D-alanyl-D-alanine carboxypeptidase family protein [Faecalicatena contorta]MCF2668647.1 D-alanyl-D-alanine carboxypeptidase [Faecalicatena contorta]